MTSRAHVVAFAVLATSLPPRGAAAQDATDSGQRATEGAATRTEAADPASPSPWSRLYFRPEWRRFDAVEYVATAAVVVSLAYLEFGTEIATDGNWSGGILFDDAARRSLRARSSEGRNRAGAYSDWAALVPQVMAVIDGLAFPLIFGDLDLAWQMTAMNIQAFATNGLLTRSGHRFVRRERPDTRPCRHDPDYDENCGRGSYASFPGGHTSTAMTGAGLICAHHLYVPLYGARWADLTACGVNVGLGVFGGVLRLAADRHYASDVIVGATVGFGLGFGLPILLHYEAGGSAEQAMRFHPWVGDGTYGASLGRTF